MATSADFWTTKYGPGETNAGYQLLSGRSPNRYHLMRLMRKRGLREVGEVLDTLLTDATPSSTASVPISRVTAVADTTANVQGGVRAIESKEKMGLTLNSTIDDASAMTARAVTAADVTTLQKELTPSGSRAMRSPATYPVDASGNGGGGKQASGR